MNSQNTATCEDTELVAGEIKNGYVFNRINGSILTGTK